MDLSPVGVPAPTTVKCCPAAENAIDGAIANRGPGQFTIVGVGNLRADSQVAGHQRTSRAMRTRQALGSTTLLSP